MLELCEKQVGISILVDTCAAVSLIRGDVVNQCKALNVNVIRNITDIHELVWSHRYEFSRPSSVYCDLAMFLCTSSVFICIFKQYL